MSNYSYDDRGRSSNRSRYADRASRQRRSSQARQQSRSGSISSQRRNTSRSSRGRQHPYLSTHIYHSLNNHDTGYSLRQSNKNFNVHRGLPTSPDFDWRAIVYLGGAIVALVLTIFAITSCVRSCSSRKSSETDDTSTNSQDARIAVDASADITATLTSALDYADTLDTIAQNADRYSDVRMVALATNEPDAAEFVAEYPDATKTSSTYTGSVTKGTYPTLYDWNPCWGYIDYADGAFGVTGSGPTVLACAYMGLTGKTDETPDSIAAIAVEEGYDTGDSGLSTVFFDTCLDKVGLSGREYTPSGDNIVSILSEGTPIAVQVSASSLTPYMHWILVYALNDDGSIQVIDPTSAVVTSHSWAAGTIGSAGEAMYALSTSETSSEDDTESTYTEDDSSDYEDEDTAYYDY